MDTYHIAIWFFVVASLFIGGFFIHAVTYAYKITAIPRAWQLIFIGRAINSIMLAWLGWQATKVPVGHLNWSYWVFTAGAIITLIGLILAARQQTKVKYGRRKTDKHRRRDDYQLKE